MTVEYLEQNNLILFRAYRGSKAYGTFIEGVSDLDEVIVYINPIEELLGLNYLNQVNEKNNDLVGYELGRFCQLLLKSNPTVLETLFMPEDCIIYKHPSMDILFENRDKFITKQMKDSFGGYAIQQISKASGLGKKMNKKGVKRADILNFCYTNTGQGSQLVTEWLDSKGLKQEYCGLVKIDHMRDYYGLYYDFIQHFQREELEWNELKYRELIKVYDLYNEDNVNVPYLGNRDEYDEIIASDINFKYKGIVQNIITSNDISLSSVIKGEKPLTNMYFNKDGYSVACKEYKEQLEWENNHNPARFIDVQSHGQKNKEGSIIDGKNMLHCVRIIRMYYEVMTGQGIKVRRTEDAQELIDIRHGVYDLPELITKCQTLLKECDALVPTAPIADTVDRDYLNDILVNMRKEYYDIKPKLIF